jgi:hypothetical protein
MNKPTFCPNLVCKLHRKEVQADKWYYREGRYATETFGKVQRFRCKRCGKYFSSQTFDIDYYAKRIIDYRELMKKVVSTSSTRDIARDFAISTETVQNKLLRLAHQAMAIHEELKKGITKADDIVVDGFESYCVSQYFPNNIHLFVLKESQYLYFTNYVTIRRKGRMTSRQKRRRSMLEERFWPEYKGIERGFSEVLDEIVKFKSTSGNIQTYMITDEKIDYIRACKSHGCFNNLVKNKQIITKRISSKNVRSMDNPLFPVNYLDRLMRKDLSNQVRETVCFSRNVNNCMEKQMIYLFYHNYIKVFREKQRKNNTITHAEVAGIQKHLISDALDRFFKKRVFYSLSYFSGFIKRLWKRNLFTPLKQKVDYVPKYALA